MKIKILSIIAAAALSLGGATAATTASADTGAAPAVVAGSNVSGGIQLAHYRPYWHRHGYGWRYRRMCRRLYILGFKYGNWRARRAYYRHCVRRPYRPYRPYGWY